MNALCFRRGSVQRWASFCGLVFLVFTGCRKTEARSPAARQDDRYLSILDCGAELHRFEAATGKPVTTVALAQKSSLISTHGDVAGSTVNGCSANGAIYVQPESIFATLVPTLTRGDAQEKQQYSLLRFHLPDLQPLDPIALPGAYETAPMLSLSSTGSVQADSANAKLSLVNGKFIPSSKAAAPTIAGSHPLPNGGPMLTLELAGYDASGLKLTGASTTLVYTPLERSGTTVLLQFVRAGQGFAYALIDTTTKRIVALNPGFSTTAENVHLAPTGKAVLAQEAIFTGGMQVAQTTGKLALLDASSGTAVRIWSDVAAVHSAEITITPSGLAVFFAKNQYRFVPLKQVFPVETIYRLQERQTSSYFYADR